MKDVGNDNVVFLVSRPVLNLFIGNDISDNHFKIIFGNTVFLHVFFCCIQCAGIQVRSLCMTGSVHQGHYRQYSAAASDIENLGILRYVFANLTDAESRRFMCSGSERRTGIDMKYLSGVFRHFLFFPGRNNKQIINEEPVEILFPVVNPVKILGFGNQYRSFSDIRILLCFFKHRIDIGKKRLHIKIITCFHKEIQISDSVILFRLRRNIHKHLLLFQRTKRDFILNLRAFQTDILHVANQNILCIGDCFNRDFFPLHILFFLPGCLSLLGQK